jgi:hypothetical protein
MGHDGFTAVGALLFIRSEKVLAVDALMESHVHRVLRFTQMKNRLTEMRRVKRNGRVAHFSARLCTCLHKAGSPGSTPWGKKPGLCTKTVGLLSKICTEFANLPEPRWMKP